KAKALLTEAGYPNGFSFKITVASVYPQHVQTAEIISEQLKAVGVNAKIEPVEWATWLSETYTNRKYDATVVGVDASALTARAMLDRYVSTASNNFMNYNNAEFDSTFQEAMLSTDENTQTELYKKCLTILSEDAANVFIQDLCENVAMASDIQGYEFYPVYILDFSNVYRTGK
ncbi:MAG: ABC transporter substrate-binding protein, partial [Oscillospiraceae bacterium]|nr:ABC transporter substrate-binding protein [Oscillospiraceae bacterium]